MLAFDRATVRTKDVDGRLHVALNPIGKANVCPYMGHEIPDFEALGLDGDRVYMLLRDPEELAKAAPTFNNLQVLMKHKPVNANEPAREITVGSTGTDALWDAPYVKNTLVVWDQEGIDLIEKDEAKEISPAYRYRADMTPGEYEGLQYDGIMRDIIGNHVALVPEGRQGPDVVVGDSKLEIEPVRLTTRTQLVMHGALAAYVLPKIAQDAKVDLTGALKGVNKGNGKDKVPAIVAAVTTLTKGKLAQDADISDIAEVVEAVATLAASAAETDEIAEDEEDEETKDKVAEDEDDMDVRGETVSKPAMDAAIQGAVASAVARVEAIHEAKRDVQPVIGEIAVAQDSAAAVYKLALDHMGVDLTDVPAAAYRATFRALRAAQPAKPTPQLAQDAKRGLQSFNDRFPEAVKLKGH